MQGNLDEARKQGKIVTGHRAKKSVQNKQEKQAIVNARKGMPCNSWGGKGASAASWGKMGIANKQRRRVGKKFKERKMTEKSHSNQRK